MKKNKSYMDNLKASMETFCRDLKGAYIGTEHAFLALISEKNTPMVDYLKKYKVTVATFKTSYLKVVGDTKADSPSTLEYTPVLKTALNEATRISDMRSIELTPEIVMIQLLRCCGESVAVRVLEGMGFGLNEQEAFDDFLCDQVSLSNIGVDLGEDFCTETDIADVLRGGSDKNKYPFLTDLCKSVKDNETCVVGFEDELEELIKALLRYKKPNIILLGEPGVGKTALVEKLAIAINNKEVPSIIANYKILQLSISSALSGTRYRGEFEEKLEGALNMVSKNKNIILFIDEIHNIVGAGASCDSTLDAGNILKPYLSRGSIRIIGATTNEEYERIKEDGALARRFKTMEILEPNVEQTMEILKAMKPIMQKQYGVKLSDKILKEVYQKSTYRKGRMPDIALDELEEYCIDIYYENSKKEKVDA